MTQHDNARPGFVTVVVSPDLTLYEHETCAVLVRMSRAEEHREWCERVTAAAGEPQWEYGAALFPKPGAGPGYIRGSRETAEEGVAHLKRVHPDDKPGVMRRRPAVAPGEWEVAPGA